jgi:hypothetical protein
MGPITGSLDGTGSLSVSTIADNLQIAPAGSMWRVTICPNASTQCTAINISLSGSAVNISNAVNAQIAPITVKSTLIWPSAYQDSEVGPLQNGIAYYNTTTGVPRGWFEGSWFNIVGSGVNLSSPPPSGDVTPNTIVGTTINSVVNPMAYPGIDIGAKINTAIVSACLGLQCHILIPPQTVQLNFSTSIVLGNNTTLECSQGGQVSNGTPAVTNQLLAYTGNGVAVTLSGYGARVTGCDFVLSSSATKGIDVQGYSNHIDDVGMYGGGSSTIMFHVGKLNSAEDNHINKFRCSAFIGICVQVDHANDTFLNQGIAYGTVGNVTGITLLIESGAGGTHATNFVGGNSGLHGLVIRNTISPLAQPTWMFVDNFESNLSYGSGWNFDSSLGTGVIGFNAINSWSAGSATGAGIEIHGGSEINITGGNKIRANWCDGILVSG